MSAPPSGPAAMPFGERPAWRPERPRLRPTRLVVSWFMAALALLVAAWLVPGVSITGFWGAVLVAALIAVLNAFLPPVIAALRLPYSVGLSFVLVLLLDALLLSSRPRSPPAPSRSTTSAGPCSRR